MSQEPWQSLRQGTAVSLLGLSSPTCKTEAAARHSSVEAGPQHCGQDDIAVRENRGRNFSVSQSLGQEA